MDSRDKFLVFCDSLKMRNRSQFEIDKAMLVNIPISSAMACLKLMAGGQVTPEKAKQDFIDRYQIDCSGEEEERILKWCILFRYLSR